MVLLLACLYGCMLVLLGLLLCGTLILVVLLAWFYCLYNGGTTYMVILHPLI